MRGIQLPNSVPVDTGTIVLKTVCNCNDDLLSLVSKISITDALKANGYTHLPNKPESRDLDTRH